MRTPYYIAILGILALAGSAGIASDTDISLKHFRFGKHTKQDFERLVIQFSGNRPDPRIQIVPSPTRTEASVSLENIRLVGAIPESAINESYVNRSRYLGPISINTDDPNRATTLRVFLKENTLKFDAFWIHNPPRLVVDAFPATSPRSSKGRFILAKTKKKVEKREPASVTFGTRNVVCFPVASQLAPTVSFKEQFTPTAGNFVKESKSGPIACYPVDAKVDATIYFAPASRVPQSSVAAAQQSGYTPPKLLPPPQRSTQPPKMPTPPGLTAPNGPPPGAPPRLPNSGGNAQLENTGGKGSRVNAGGFSPVTPLGSKLGAGGPVAPAVDPSKLLPFQQK